MASEPRSAARHGPHQGAVALGVALVVLWLGACGHQAAPRFALRAPVWRDGDLDPVYAPCHRAPRAGDPGHVACAPQPYEAPIYWDGVDSMVLRPLSQALGVVTSGESVDVNSMDEVPDSAWFTNRLGVRPMSLDELRLAACSKAQLLDPDRTPDGAWLIDQGKTSGSTPGFVIRVPGKGKYLIKVEATGMPERQVAATVIGEAVYYATGYNASCEQALLVRPSIFRLAPGLRATKGNFGDEYPFDRKALFALFAKANKRGGLLRVSASAWVHGYIIGQFRYEGTRADDPNDVIAHEDRRELRAARVLASWIDDFDERQGNSLDAWLSDVKGAPADSSPGHVVHVQIGTSAALGSVWDWDPVSRRLGYSYLLDWGDLATDFITLGAVTHPWDTIQKTPAHEEFGYFNVADFQPDRWKNEIPNPAFSRMTERDAAWMARILARFSPAMVRALAEMGRLREGSETDYLERVLDGRLDKILDRYLTRLSPLAEAHIERATRLCAVDLAEQRALRAPARFHYTARVIGAGWLRVQRRAGGAVCVDLPRNWPDERLGDSAVERYVRVRIQDGVAPGPLVAHLYNLGPDRGYFLAGLQRPQS